MISSHLMIACSNVHPPSSIPPQPIKINSTQFNQQLSRSNQLSLGIQKAYAIPAHTANRLSPLIVTSADQHGVSPLLLAAVIKQESGYRSSVISSAGAVGLTQVIPYYWQAKCPGNLYNENLNIHCGTYILSTYNKIAGDWSKALAYYNVGPYGYKKNLRMRQQGIKYARSVQRHHIALIDALDINSNIANHPKISSPYTSIIPTIKQ